TSPRARVQTTNHWKLVGAVVGGLCLIVGLAMIFQHRPAEVSSDSASDQPASSAARTPAPFSRPSAKAQPQAQTPAPPQPQRPPVQTQTRASARSGRGRAAYAAPVAPPAPSEGQLLVTSMPAGASVEIAGRLGQAWTAPQTVPGLAPGTYKVTFSMPGYAP